MFRATVNGSAVEPTVGTVAPEAPRRKLVLTRILWLVTFALLSVWGFGCLTRNAMGGFVNGFLIATAVMVFVTLFIGQRAIPSPQPLPSRKLP